LRYIGKRPFEGIATFMLPCSRIVTPVVGEGAVLEWSPAFIGSVALVAGLCANMVGLRLFLY
jgi:hypothetical protein